MTDERAIARRQFLQRHGMGPADAIPLTADASTRCYFRLPPIDGVPALLMDAPPGAEAPVCPPGASAGERQALGYNAMARLAGSRLDAFTSIATWLSDQGIRAPQIMAADPSDGFALIEDLGSQLLADLYADGSDAALESAYGDAVAMLSLIQSTPVVPQQIGSWDLQEYDALALKAEADLFVEWYLSFVGDDAGSPDTDAWDRVWAALLSQLSPPSTLVLRDFHAENIVLPDASVTARLGVIDFQDALVGQAAYDLVSLLEDARVDVPASIRERLYDEAKAKAPDPEQFATDYAILAVQRNLKILGVFARLIKRDGKEKYRAFFPRVEAHVRRDLGRPAVAALADWMRSVAPGLLDAGRAVP